MAMIYFTSDTHYGHKNVIDYSKRPFSSVQEMNECLLDNYNKVIKPNDEVYHLGDFAFQKPEDMLKTLSSLNGRKSLILGNHDEFIRKNQSMFLGKDLFLSIQDYKIIHYNKIKFCLLHFPMRSWEKSHSGSIHLHGHCHGSLEPYKLSVDIGVDSKFITEEYRPISIVEIMDFMSKRKLELSEIEMSRLEAEKKRFAASSKEVSWSDG